MRRLLKISGWAVSGLALLILLLGVALFIAGNTGTGRAMIEKLTNRLTSGHVELSGLNGSFPQHLTLGRLQLSDHRGIWLTAEQVTLDWSPLMLLARRLQIDVVHANAVNIERLPEASPDASESGPVSIPHIDVAAMAVDRATLGPELAGTAASMSLRGSAHLRSVQDMIIDANAHRIDGDGSYVLQLRFDPRRMEARLSLHEPAGGPLENLVKLPGLGALAATASLNGPRGAEHLEVAVDAGAFRGRARGTFNLDDLSADFGFAIDSPALAPRADLAWDRASIHGRWHGSFKAPQADGHVEIDQLRLPGATQVASVNGDFSAESGAAALHAVIGGLMLSGPRPQLLRDSPVTIDATLRLDDAARPLDVTASHRLFALHASAQTAAISGRNRSASVELRLPNLGEFGIPCRARHPRQRASRGTAARRGRRHPSDGRCRRGAARRHRVLVGCGGKQRQVAIVGCPYG